MVFAIVFLFDENAVDYSKYLKETINQNIEVASGVSYEILRIHFRFLPSQIGDETFQKYGENK